MKRTDDQARMAMLRTGWFIYLSWLGCVLYTVYMGVRSWPPFALSTTLVCLCIAHSGWLLTRRSVSTPSFHVLATLTFAAIASFSCWLGPFVLVPLAAACAALVFVVQARRSERRVVLALALASAVAPYLVELLHLGPPGFVFRDGELVLLPRVIEIDPSKTLIGLMYISAAFTIAPSFYITSLRDSLKVAERKVFLNSWHFEQFAHDKGADSRKPPGTRGEGSREG
jgi:hypothetical protein